MSGRAAAYLHSRRTPPSSGAFGIVPTPALVAPLEFTLLREDYLALGGHADRVLSLPLLVEQSGD